VIRQVCSVWGVLTVGLVVGGLWPAQVLAAPGVAPRRAAKRGSTAWKKANPSRVSGGLAPRVGRRAAPVINLLNLHTGERLPVVGGRLPSRRLTNRFFRCRWTGRRIAMAPQLLRWVVEAALHFGAREVHVVSAFRHAKFNEMLRKKGRQVARRSNHRLGKAVDFNLVGVDVDRLVAYLKRRKLGGIGRYPHSKFVHLDTGRYRTWGGK
jgi:Bacterial protein of unknown function (DUF882)